MFLDKKSLAFIIAASACIITLVFFLNKEEKGNSFSYTDGSIDFLVDKNTDSFKDTDEDGLKDWEEALWGTNPLEKDSDKDGVLDFDQIKKQEQENTSNPKKESTPLTQTDILGRNLFSKFASLKQVGLSSDQESIQNAAQSVAGAGLVSEYVPYKESIVKISSDNSNEAIKAYGNNIFSIIFNNAPKSARSEIMILKDSLEKNDVNILKELDPVIQGYEKILNGFINLPVPKELAETHLMLINGVNKILYVNLAFKKSFADPVYSVQGLSLYENSEMEFRLAIRQLKNIIVSKNIVYSEGESAYLMTKAQ